MPISNASSRSLPSALDRISSSINSEEWLPASHPFAEASDLTSFLDSENIKHDIAITSHADALQEFVAMSAISHTVEAFSFLTASVKSLIDGDNYSALHYSYYTELRAALGILASHGVCHQNHKYFYIDSTGKCYGLEGGSTHKKVWKYLKEWAETSSEVSSLFTENVYLDERTSLKGLLDAIQVDPKTVNKKYVTWMKTWGLDLQELSNDKILRNSASYNPLFVNPTDKLLTFFGKARQGINDTWRLFSYPKATLFDTFISSNVLKEIHQLRATGLTFEDWLKSIFEKHAINPVDLHVSRIVNQVNDNRLTEALTYDTAETNTPNAIQVHYRSLMLLRLSIAGCEALIEKTQNPDVFKRLIKDKLAVNFEISSLPDELADLWFEIDEAIGDNIIIDEHPCKNDGYVLEKLGSPRNILLWNIT